MAPAAYFATATKARKRGPTETGNEMAPEHWLPFSLSLCGDPSGLVDLGAFAPAQSPLAHSQVASGLDMLCAYAPEFSHFILWLFGIGWGPHGSETRRLFLGLLFGADCKVSPRWGWVPGGAGEVWGDCGVGSDLNLPIQRFED